MSQADQAKHPVSDAVAALVERVRNERGRLDVLVNDIFGGDRYADWDHPLSEHDLAGGLRMLAASGNPERWSGRIVTSRELAEVYDVADIDGSRPDAWGYIRRYGIGEQTGRNVDAYR